MKKKLSIMMVLLLALIIAPKEVKAETARFDFSCSKEDLRTPGETSDCTLSIVDVTAGTPVTNVNVGFKFHNLDVVTKFAPSSQFTSKGVTSDGIYQLEGNVASASATNPVPVGTLKVQVQDSITDCGKICVVVQYSTAADGYSSQNDYQVGALSNDECNVKPAEQPKPTSPPTGTFASYALLAGGAAIALGIITYSSRSTKFYRV